MWRHLYHVDYAIHKGFLVILSSDFKGIRHFFIPLGLNNNGLREVVDDMIAWSFERKEDFRMISLTDKMLLELGFLGPDFIISPPEVWDYVYNADDLIYLKGKKFHAKRNHINKFNNLYKYEYKDLEQKHIPACLELLDAWAAENGFTNSVAIDDLANREALVNFKQIKMTGGCLFVDGNLAAYSLGQPVNKETYAIHTEKALYRYEGVYSKINQLFAERNCKGYKYINREDDMGLEGLRKSKMSYYPVLLLNKHTGVLPYA